MKYLHLENFESYELNKEMVIFVEAKDNTEFIHVAVEAIRARELANVPMMLVAFNTKIFCVQERTTVIDMLDDLEASYEHPTGKAFECIALTM